MQPKSRKLILLVLLGQLIAFWPVWRWYFFRIVNSPDEIAGIASIAAALLLIWMRRRSLPVSQTGGATAPRIPLLWPVVLNVIYCLIYPFSPPLIRGMIAFWAIGVTLTSFLGGNGWRQGIIGLLMLGLPIIPTLQFYLGFPMRWLAGTVTVPLLRGSGFSVSLTGTCLDWCGRLIMIDAPCSGVKMLWAGLFLTCYFVAFYDTNAIETSLSLLCAVMVILLGNILRTAGLFYLEAGVIQGPAWAHEGLGLISFILVVGLIYLGFQWIRGNRRCTGISSI